MEGMSGRACRRTPCASHDFEHMPNSFGKHIHSRRHSSKRKTRKIDTIRRTNVPFSFLLLSSPEHLILRLEAFAVDDAGSGLVVPGGKQSKGIRTRSPARFREERNKTHSCFEIHICWKVESEARMEPPIQTEYFLSGGATILTFIDEGDKLCKREEMGCISHREKLDESDVKRDETVISFCIRSAIPEYMVVPPERTMFP